jgi:hypothetical protein
VYCCELLNLFFLKDTIFSNRVCEVAMRCLQCFTYLMPSKADESESDESEPLPDDEVNEDAVSYIIVVLSFNI